MLAELLEYLVTPCPPSARRLGYLKEAVAIKARHRRCKAAWREHLAKCRTTIIEAARGSVVHGTALVLGSGALLDIPLEVLSGLFDTVVLLDLVHPLGARLRARALPNVSLVTADVTGVVEAVAAGRLPQPVPFPAPLDLRPDFTVSANILSQLPLLPLKALAGKHPPEALEAFAGVLVRQHVNWLYGLGGTVLLLADILWRSGQEETDPLHGMPLPAPFRAWTWAIAPRPEIRKDCDIIHQVGAFLLDAPAAVRCP